MHLDSPQQSQTPPINISILSSISADASMSKSDCNSNSNSPNISIQQSFTSLHSNILLTCQWPQCVPKDFIVFNNNSSIIRFVFDRKITFSNKKTCLFICLLFFYVFIFSCYIMIVIIFEDLFYF